MKTATEPCGLYKCTTSTTAFIPRQTRQDYTNVISDDTASSITSTVAEHINTNQLSSSLFNGLSSTSPSFILDVTVTQSTNIESSASVVEYSNIQLTYPSFTTTHDDHRKAGTKAFVSTDGYTESLYNDTVTAPAVETAMTIADFQSGNYVSLY